MTKEQALDELRRLGYRQDNGPAYAGYQDIHGEAVTVVCDLLEAQGMGDVAERFREVLARPVEEG